MPFLTTMPEDAGPPSIYAAFPEIYGPWSQMSQALMNGSSPFSEGERELMLAFAAGAAGCDFVRQTHAEVAYAWGLERGLVDRLLESEDAAEPNWRPLLAYIRKLSASPTQIQQCDVSNVLAAGWDERALHDAVSIVARAAFMQRLVQGYGFAPLPQEVAARHAARRVERGYINLYRAFRAPAESVADGAGATPAPDLPQRP